MSSLFTDGFDHYTTLSEKWDTVAGSPVVSGTYARTGTGGLLHPATTSSLTKTIAAVSGVVVGKAINLQTTGSFSTTTPQWTFSGGGTVHASAYIDANRRVVLYHTTGSSVIGSGTTQLTVGQWHYVTLQVNLGGSGNTEIWVDKAREFTTGVSIAGSSIDSVSSKGLSGTYWMDDLYLFSTTGSSNTGVVGPVFVETLLPSSAGTKGQWTANTGTNWEAVDESPPDSDTTYVAASTSGDIDSYNYPSLPAYTDEVFAVQYVAYAKMADTGTQSMRFITRQGGTETPHNAVTVSGTDYTHYLAITDTDPTDSSAWTTAKVDSAEFGTERQ